MADEQARLRHEIVGAARHRQHDEFGHARRHMAAQRCYDVARLADGKRAGQVAALRFR